MKLVVKNLAKKDENLFKYVKATSLAELLHDSIGQIVQRTVKTL